VKQLPNASVQQWKTVHFYVQGNAALPVVGTHNSIYTYEQLQQLLLAGKTRKTDNVQTELSVTPA